MAHRSTLQADAHAGITSHAHTHTSGDTHTYTHTYMSLLAPVTCAHSYIWCRFSPQSAAGVSYLKSMLCAIIMTVRLFHSWRAHASGSAAPAGNSKLISPPLATKIVAHQLQLAARQVFAANAKGALHLSQPCCASRKRPVPHPIPSLHVLVFLSLFLGGGGRGGWRKDAFELLLELLVRALEERHLLAVLLLIQLRATHESSKASEIHAKATTPSGACRVWGFGSTRQDGVALASVRWCAQPCHTLVCAH